MIIKLWELSYFREKLELYEHLAVLLTHASLDPITQELTLCSTP